MGGIQYTINTPVGGLSTFPNITKKMKADLVIFSDMGMNFTLNFFPSNPQNKCVLSKKQQLRKRHHFLFELVMAQNLGQGKSSKSKPIEKVHIKDTNSEERPNKCNQSSHRGNLKIHLMTHGRKVEQMQPM